MIRSRCHKPFLFALLVLSTHLLPQVLAAGTPTQTVALWLFDEQVGLYPSSLMTDAGPNDLAIVLGRGGRILPGKFGNALEAAEPTELKITNAWLDEQQALFGLIPTPKAPGRTVEPMTWRNARFCALLTRGESHLRHMTFANATDTGLNLGDFDWTVEFWFKATRAGNDEGVLFEVGTGPRAENDVVTRLSITASLGGFLLTNQPSGTALNIPSDPSLLGDGRWHHLAFVYRASEDQLRHWVDGKPQKLPAASALKALPAGEEAYMSIGRDGRWQRPMPGAIDELRFSKGAVYGSPFEPPDSFSKTFGNARPPLKLAAGAPLLFPGNRPTDGTIDLGSRKHLFIDDVIVDQAQGVRWVANPPSIKELVLDDFHGHLTVIQDDDGLIRMYGSGPHDYLVVWTSEDGIHFKAPVVGTPEVLERKNIVVPYRTGAGQVFIDPNAPAEQRWKYLSGIQGQGIFIFSSPDGYRFKRHETAALPFAAGSQSNIFYDDQRQLYVAYHRSDYGFTSMTGQETERRFVLTECKDLLQSWSFQPVTVERTAEVARTLRIKSHLLDPWYLDNGPLAPAGIGIEFPVVFGPDYDIDPPHTDIYVPKATKYAHAPDTYLAFPHIYFHYWDVDAPGRAELGLKRRGRGSGTIEVQTMVSRDGLNWKRYPRPAYVGIGEYGDMGRYYMVTMVQGMVRRGDEIWQYFAGSPEYHSAWPRDKHEGRRGVFRMVQRLDGFVSVDAEYTGGQIVTKPLKFKGNRLKLNINTGAAGYARVGILDEDGEPIEGYSVDDCVWINGNTIEQTVEWLGRGADLSALSGRVIRLRFDMRGTKLFAMQFTED